MSVLDIFRKKEAEKPRKKSEEKPVRKTKPVEKIKSIEKEKLVKKEGPAEKKKAEPILKTSQAWQSLVMPHVTEKATDLASKNQYIFKVFKRANKNQIKKAVESLYNVDVNNVKIINVKRKKRKLGRIEGFKPGYKKAIVSVKKGQEIELLPR
jgi:large subunit ribosomal protein L23